MASIERRVAFAELPPASDLGAKVLAAMTPWRDKVKAEADAIVATLPRACVARGQDGSAFGEQIARAMRDRIKDVASPPAGVPVVGLINAGSVRAPLAAGPLRFADLFNAMPFENMTAVCATTRAGLVRVVNNALKHDSSRERFPLSISGARLHVTREPGGGLTLAGVDIEGEPAARARKDDAPVWLAVSDFVLFGGDGFLKGVSCAQTLISQVRVRDAFRDLIAREQGGCDGPARNILVEPQGRADP